MSTRHGIRRFSTAFAVTIAFTVAFGVGAGPATASSVEGFGAGGSRAKVKDMALMEGASGTFSDKYTIEADFKGGGDIYFSIHLSSFGIGDPKLVVKSRYRYKGKTIRTEEKLSPSAWSQETEDGVIDIRMGRHSLKGNPKEWTFTAADEENRFEVTFKPVAPPWRPGNGRAKFDSDYLDMTVLAPRAKATGTVKVGDDVREVKGTGYALHSYSSLAPHETAKRMVGFRTERGALAFYFKEIDPAGRWAGAEPIRWLLVARKGKVLFQTTDFTLTPAEISTDTKHPNQYAVPHAFKLEAKDGDRTLTAVIKATKQKERSDRLAELSKMERAIAAQFAKPVYYAFDAAYEVRVDEGDGAKPEEFKGRGIYELDHLNK